MVACERALDTFSYDQESEPTHACRMHVCLATLQPRDETGRNGEARETTVSQSSTSCSAGLLARSRQQLLSHVCVCVYDTTTYTTTTSVFGGTARRSVGAFKLEAAAPDRVISSTDHFSPRDDMAAAAATVETLEEEVVVGGQVLERDGGGGGGGGGGRRRRKPQGWKTSPCPSS